jgi:hypothetical protein
MPISLSKISDNNYNFSNFTAANQALIACSAHLDGVEEVSESIAIALAEDFSENLYDASVDMGFNDLQMHDIAWSQINDIITSLEHAVITFKVGYLMKKKIQSYIRSLHEFGYIAG